MNPDKNQPYIVGIKIVCVCSDLKEREVIMNPKLASSIMGFIRHRQNGILKLSEGVPIKVPIQIKPTPVSEEKGKGL